MLDRDWNTFSENYQEIKDLAEVLVAVTDPAAGTRTAIFVGENTVSAVVAVFLALDNILENGRRNKVANSVIEWHDRQTKRCWSCDQYGHDEADCPEIEDEIEDDDLL